MRQCMFTDIEGNRCSHWDFSLDMYCEDHLSLLQNSETLPSFYPWPPSSNLMSDLAAVQAQPPINIRGATASPGPTAQLPNIPSPPSSAPSSLRAIGNPRQTASSHTCKHCGKVSKRRYDHNKHLRTHTGEKPFVCGTCNQAFGDQSVLSRHQRVHSSEQAFVCKICDKSFSQKSNLSRHIRIHTGETRFACEICGRRFNAKGNLNTHRKTHNDYPPSFHVTPSLATATPSVYNASQKFLPPSSAPAAATSAKETSISPELLEFCRAIPSQGAAARPAQTANTQRPKVCLSCGQGFNCESDLTRHLRTHTGEQPFKCDTCGKSFARQGSLSRHQDFHADVRPFNCDRCGKRFSQKHDLTKHERTHTGERPYKCNRCDKSFSQKGNLTTHARLHTGKRPYKCNRCDKSFSQKGNLTRHLQTHQPKPA